MRSMKWKLLCIVMLCWLIGFSRAYAEDFKIGSSITIMHFTDEAKTAIEAVEGKENKNVIVDKACSIDDFSAICQMDWIRQLEIAGNEEIHDLAPIANLKGLQYLKLSCAKATKTAPFDLTPLAQLTNLESITFFSTKVTNIHALSGLKNLKRVNLYMSAVDSIDFLKGTPEVWDLDLYGNQHTFKDYEPLLGLKKLRRLQIYMNKQATDELLAPLEVLTSLQQIEMSNCKNVTTLNFLKNCRDMRKITAMWCESIDDFSAVARMDLLESARIQKCKISDISIFEGKKSLSELDISKTSVSDISALKSCVALKSLNISETSVSDISALSGCLNLSSLNIEGTTVKDLSPLVNCDKLISLGVSETVPQEQIDNLMSVLPNLKITGR